MEMLEYCKTYSIMKSNLSNPVTSDLSSQKGIIAVDKNGEERSVGDGATVVVETIQRLTAKPGDFALYHSVQRSTKDSECEPKKLSPLKELSRSKSMVSSIKTLHKDLLSFESELTFAPKLNALSIKLAKERGEKMRNATLSRRPSYQNTEDEAIFTFKPRVSSNSAKIVQNLKTTFLDRQLLHMEKQKRNTSEVYSLPYHPKNSRLSPVQMIKSPSKSRKHNQFKGCNDSIEEEEEDPPSETPSKDSLTTFATDLSNPVSNSSSTTDVENGKVDETENDNEKENNSSEMEPSFESKTTKSNQDSLDSKAKRLQEQSPYNQSVENLYLNKQKRTIRAHQRAATYPVTIDRSKAESGDEWNNSTKVATGKSTTSNKTKNGNHSRTRSQHGHCKMKYEHPLFEKVRHAKGVAESAIKNKKVFICHGPYPIVRASLRRRGYVEKHYQGCPLIKKKTRKNKANDSDDDSASSDGDSDDNHTPNTFPRGKVAQAVLKTKGSPSKENVKSDEDKKDGGGDSCDDMSSDDDDDDDSDDEDWNAGYEEGGPDSEFNLMSRMVRNAVASFIWTVRRDDVDFKYLQKDQTVNHFSRSYSFTTKVGLCTNLHNLVYYEEVDPMTFFPRCHRLDEDDKLEFIDDYRIGAAINIVKWVISRYENGPVDENAVPTTNDPIVETTIEKESTQGNDESPVEVVHTNVLPVKALTSSLEACREYLRRQDHLDVDDPINSKPVISEALWDEIINHSYELRQSHTIIARAFPFLRECQNVMNKLKEHMPQIDIDGQRNVWIVKPGAKSRGRGIMCMDRLEDILKLTGSIIGQKEGRWVVQKYIERPLLIYRVKFDIRQWYLVTDWNPLTIWFYQDCYLRFCSHNFSLEDFHVSIHLANNSVQKHFENDKVRDKRLPEENMWSSDEFKSYLRKNGLGNMWDNVIYPGMKQTVIYAMESCQEIVEYRKNSFELYGADFIIGDDCKPWLIEINCSPTMGASTGVTRKLCAQVVEDTMKVVIDRREDKNCDTGRFELAFKQAHVSAPPYIGVNLSVEGQGITRRSGVARRPSTSSKLTNLTRPRDSKNTLNDSVDEKHHEKRENFKLQNHTPTKNSVKRCEGSWAIGCPVHTRPQTVEKITKRLRVKSRNGGPNDIKGQGQPKLARTMTIPKAVVRYSTGNIPQKTQMPISIGPNH